MNTLFKPLMIAFWVMLSLATSALGAEYQNNSIVFQIIQNQMVFDSSTVESATISPPQDNSAIYGINIKLKPAAAKKLEKLTRANIGKISNIIFNKQVISSPVIQSSIGGQFLIVGFTKEQAEQFINGLSP